LVRRLECSFFDRHFGINCIVAEQGREKGMALGKQRQAGHRRHQHANSTNGPASTITAGIGTVAAGS